MIISQEGAQTGATFWQVLLQNRRLVVQMIKREVVGRYHGSWAGLLWSLLNPLFMMVVYAFVFSVVFKARWNSGPDDGHAQFGLVLFSGLIVHGFVAECLMRAPRLVIDHATYVKRVVFPLEVLPLIQAGAALFHAGVSYAVLIGGLALLGDGVSPAALWLPVVLGPLVLGVLGVTWFLASLGVFVRDVQQVIGMLMTALLFLTPIFYPVSALPERFQHLMFLNPLTLFVEQSRALLVWHQPVDWRALAAAYACSSLIAWLGHRWFQKTRKGFADVL